jgi:branched-chain amino acid transport system ATP-binding protein
MLEVTGLHVHYGAIRAVRGVTFSVAAGETVALLGANGAGKSSTLLAVAGALKKTAGTVSLDSHDITRATPEQVVRRGVAMVPETRDVFPDLSVAENLRLGAYIHRRDGAGVASDQARMLALFPWLNERMHQAAGTLSGGEQQMLVIARAMMSRPKLLLLDEPSLGLAPLIVDQVFDMIGALKSTGIGILLVEQNANKALAVADRAYVMRLGEIAAAGSAAEIAAGSNLHTLYLGAQP